jgi:CYTH domain-containing protein
MSSAPKYAKIERERRFLLERLPQEAIVVRTRRIADRYIHGARLRLREQTDDDGSAVFKLTQKISERGDGAQQGFITTMYLKRDEFDVLAQLPANTLAKSRYSVPPFGIDVFEDQLEGLVLAEAEFASPEDAAALEIPSFICSEVSADDRFTGGRLVLASRDELRARLAEYGIHLPAGNL